MATDKEKILSMLKELPDNISIDEMIEAIYVRQKIQKGLKDAEEGNVFTHEEAKEILEKWLE